MCNLNAVHFLSFLLQLTLVLGYLGPLEETEGLLLGQFEGLGGGTLAWGRTSTGAAEDMHGQAGTVPLEMRTDWRELQYIYRIVLLSMVHACSMVILIAIAIP